MRIAIAATLLCGAALTAPSASAMPDACGSLGGIQDAGGLCHVEATNPDYTMDLKFPVDYPDEKAIVDYLTQTRDGFVNVSQGPDVREQQTEMDVTAESFQSATTRGRYL